MCLTIQTPPSSKICLAHCRNFICLFRVVWSPVRILSREAEKSQQLGVRRHVILRWVEHQREPHQEPSRLPLGLPADRGCVRRVNTPRFFVSSQQRFGVMDIKAPSAGHSSRVLDRPCYSSQVSNGPCYSS